MYSKDFSMAGKTGTAQANYRDKSKLHYVSSFAGYFPADNPKYSCIVVVHKPNVSAGYYGADVAGPVFKRIAQKIYTDAPPTNHIQNISKELNVVESSYAGFYKQNQNGTKIPNVKGMQVMDAIALLENLGLNVQVNGVGKVKKQSLNAGEIIQKNKTIILELS